MEHLDFIVWMLGYSLVSDIGKTLHWKFGERKVYSDDVKGWAAFIEMVIYFGIGASLW